MSQGEPTQPEESTDVESSPGLIGRLLAPLDRGRAWAAANRRTAILGGAAVAILATTFAIVGFSEGEPELTPEQRLALAFQRLDEGNVDAAAAFAADLRASQSLHISLLGDPSYILGVASYESAQQSWGDKRRRYYLMASAYLDESRDYGFPPEREAEGLYLLGVSLLEAGFPDRAAPVLEEALVANPGRAAELHRSLAVAYSTLPTPQLDRALEHNQNHVAAADVADAERFAGLLERAQLLAAANKTGEARETLRQIPVDSDLKAQRLLVEAQILMAEAAPAGGAIDAKKLREAIGLLREAQADDDLQNHATPAAMYLIAVCLRQLGERPAALDQARRTIKQFPESPAALAAAFVEAQTLRELGRDQEALASYGRVLKTLDEEGAWRNAWLSLDALRKRTLAAYQAFLEMDRFAAAIELAEQLDTLFSQADALAYTAQAYEQWGRTLLDRAETDPPPAAPATREEAYIQLRHAGRLYMQLARLRTATNEYPEHLWSAANNYLVGHDYESAVLRLQEYLTIEFRQRRPLAFLGLGEALLAQDQVDAALAALDNCIVTDPRSAAAYQARLFAAQALARKGEVDKAAAQLLENLENSSLTPASREWRDSLFELGRLMHRAGRWTDAIARLDEAAQRYADDPRAVEATYLIAVAYSRAAADQRRRFSTDATIQQQLAHSREEDRLWSEALAAYDVTLAALLELQDERALSRAEAAILRNCFFGRGSIAFQLGEYEQAIQAYLTAVNRYPRQPEVLEAYLQLFACYRRLGQPQEARSALEQAKLVLAQMPEDADFSQVTNRTRPEWIGLFDALAKY